MAAYWNIGKYIVEFEQGGKQRAEYGAELLVKLASDLKVKYGKGFSRSSLQLMRLFYIKYPNLQTSSGRSPRIRQTVSGKLQKNQTLSGISLAGVIMLNYLPFQMTSQERFMKSKASKKTGASVN